MRLTDREKRFISRQKVCRIATIDPSRTSHNVPVCHVLVGARIYFASEKRAKKVRNVARNSRITVVLDEYSDDWSRLKGLMIVADARVIEKGRMFDRARKALYRKYPQYRKYVPIEEGEAVIVELTLRKRFSWGI